MNFVTADLRAGLCHHRTLFDVALGVFSGPKLSKTSSITGSGMIKWLCYGYGASWENSWCRSGFHGNRLCNEDPVAEDLLELALWSEGCRAEGWNCDAAVSQASLRQKAKVGVNLQRCVAWGERSGSTSHSIQPDSGRKHSLLAEGPSFHSAGAMSAAFWSGDQGGTRSRISGLRVSVQRFHDTMCHHLSSAACRHL